MTVGSSSRSTSSTATRNRRSTRSATRASPRPAPTAEVLDALATARTIVIAPSNPIVSLGPILALPGLREAIGAARQGGTPVVALSGIVGGHALKGPADRMLASLGHESSALGVARILADEVDGFVLDTIDAELAPAIAGLGLRTDVRDTVMTDDAARARLAGEMLAFAETVARR